MTPAGCMTACFLLAAGGAGGGEARPNVVFLLADDLGWADVGVNNPDSFYETPNIDRLARSGVNFTRAYAACPVCSPTRAAVLTGKYPARLHLTDYIPGGRKEKLLPPDFRKQLPLEEVTLAEALKEAGYRTGFFGKWHLGEAGFAPTDQGFDVSKPRGLKVPEERFSTAIAGDVCDFIAESAGGPFFAHVCFHDVHLPFHAPADLIEKYERKAAALPPIDASKRFGREGRRDVRLVQDVPVYAAMVEELDRAVGRILDELDRRGLAGRTIVVFTSDNGGLSTSEGFPTSNAPLRAGKGWLYEGGIRVAAMLRAPGATRAGETCDAPIVSMDFYPTILELCGLPPRPEQHEDGVSLVGLLGESPTLDPRRAALFWHYPHYGNQGGAPASAVWAAGKKLIEFHEDGRCELYDLVADPGETHDLAASEPKLAEGLKKLLHAWLRGVDAQMGSPNPDFDAEAVRKWHEGMNAIKAPSSARVLPSK